MYIIWDRSFTLDLGNTDDYDEAVRIADENRGVVLDDTQRDDSGELLVVYEA